MYKKSASLRSDKWPACPGLDGRFPPDWVAGITGISSKQHILIAGSQKGLLMLSPIATHSFKEVNSYPHLEQVIFKFRCFRWHGSGFLMITDGSIASWNFSGWSCDEYNVQSRNTF